MATSNVVASAPSVTRVEIPPAQRAYYDELFKLADLDQDGVIGIKDAHFFRKAGLADAILGEIWQLADPRKEGFLDRDGFSVALSLISVAQQGKRPALEALRPAPPPPKLAEVPPFRAETPAPAALSQWVISPQEKLQYQNVFRAADDDNDGFITGAQARTLFGNSGLPMPVLGQIWSMADVNQDQKLDFQEFCIAMFLINVKKRGQELPPALPEALLASARPDATTATSVTSPPPHTPVAITPPVHAPGAATPPVTSVSNEWMLSQAEKAKFEDLFKKNDVDHDGFITGEQAKLLFGRSGLPNTELGKIWVLSDINQDQKLDKVEFFIAMALINRRITGRETPSALPEALVLSAREATPTIRKSNYDINIDDFESPIAPSPVMQAQSLDPVEGGSSAPATPNVASAIAPSPSPNVPVSNRFPTSSLPPMQPGLSPSLTAAGVVSPHVASYAGNIGMSPHLPPSAVPSYSMPGATPLTPSPALELERTRQIVAQQERAKADMNKQLHEETSIGNEVVQLLAEERAKVEALVAELRDIEAQISAQKNRGVMIKDQLNSTRLEIKNVKVQKEQLETLLKEKNEQCAEQEEILHMLNAELAEKTDEVAQVQREVEQQRGHLEMLRNATTETKNQLVSTKKQLSGGKEELYRINEESKLVKKLESENQRRLSSDSPHFQTSSPTVAQRPASPAGLFKGSGSSSPPAVRSSPSAPALDIKKDAQQQSKLPTSSTFPASSSASDFFPASNDTFSFDNGKDDPFTQPSKDGFGFGNITKDSFGAAAHHHHSDSPVSSPSVGKLNAESSFFSATDAFGESKDPFSSGEDPFASVRSTFASHADNFGFGGGGGGGGNNAFGSPNVPRTPANSVIAGSAPTPANSVIAQHSAPTPANSVIRESAPTPANSVIAPTAPTPANSVIAPTPATPANSVIAPKGTNPYAFSEEAFNEKFFNSVKFGAKPEGSESPFGGFGTTDTFGSTTDAFGSHASDSFSSASDTFGSTSDAFGSTSDAFGANNDAFGSTSDAFGSTNDAFGASADSFGSTSAPSHDAFGPDTSDTFGSAAGDAFAAAHSDAFGGSSDAFGGSNDAFGSAAGSDVFGKGSASSSDTFGTSDAFGSPFTNTFDFTGGESKKDGFGF